MAWTYETLSAAIQAYTEIDEPTFVSNIPNFIVNAETVINNYVQLPAFRKNVTGTCTTGFQYLTLPSDFLSAFSVAVVGSDSLNTYQYMLNKDVNYIREAFPYPGVTGEPQYYGIFDASTFILGPTPDQEYTIELHYYAYPASIVTNDTSWVGTNFPNVLLYGSLVEAYTYAKGEADLLQSYQAKFQEGLDSLKNLADSKDREDAYRTTQVRYPTK